MTIEMGNGFHVLFEGQTKDLLKDTDLAQFLEWCPERIGMTAVTAPQVAKTESGWAGYIIIAESHISVHSSGLEVYGDIFSCKPFDLWPALELAKGVLGLGELRVRSLERGWATR